VTRTDGASRRNILLARQVGTLLPQVVSLKPVVTPHSQNREPRGTATFAASQIEGVLGLLGLPANSPLSVLCVEVLPGPFHAAQTFTAGGGLAAAAVAPEDPLGSALGQRRILRTSPLVAVPAIC
jgi:hypothetical protein